MFRFGFDVILARIYGEHWKLTDDEAAKLSITTARVAVKWSDLFERFGEEIAMVSCAAMIVFPRAMETARQMAAAKTVEVEVVNE